MQEEIQQKSIAITIQAAKLTGKIFNEAIILLLRKMKKTYKNAKVGRNSIKRLAGEDGGTNTIDVTGRIKSFEHIARKHQIRYHIEKDNSTSIPKWTVYFKANQADALTAAFKQYTQKEIEQDKKDSLVSRLHKNMEIIKNNSIEQPLKNKVHEVAER